MIKNLTPDFPLAKLNDFDFGSAEADNDSLIESQLGFCWTLPIQEFVNGKKSIVIGERGSGKSVLFKLLKEGRLHFKKKGKNESHLILPVAEELQYGNLKEYLDAHVTAHISNPSMKYRIAWELFLLARAFTFLAGKYGASTSDEFRKANEKLSIVLGHKRDPVKLLDLLMNTKVTFGAKIGASHVGTVEPNMYVTVEPKTEAAVTANTGAALDFIEFDDYKRILNQFLEDKKLTLFVLVDKVDEFVILSEYDVQRLVLQALVETERSYLPFKNMRFKLFVRCDLFKRMSFEALGADKVNYRRIDLAWSHEDIRKLIAQRIMYNYFTAAGLSMLEFTYKDDNLYVDEKSTEVPPAPLEGQQAGIRALLARIGKRLEPALRRARSRHVEGRRIALNDEINRQIITSVFPHVVKHHDKGGQIREIGIFQYFESHFSLASGTTTPRLVVMFLDHVLAAAKEYYRGNPDEKVKLDDNGEYPLFKRSIIKTAYDGFQAQVTDSFSNVSTAWKPLIDRFMSLKTKKNEYTYPELQKIIGADTEELKRFLAFLCHIGYLKCKNHRAKHEAREYSLPILFQR